MTKIFYDIFQIDFIISNLNKSQNAGKDNY